MASSPRLARALDAERARTEQVPPAYSAIKVDGVRSHRLARRGEAATLPARPVAVRSLVCTRETAAPPSLELAMTVSKGYYVRSLARDLGAALGTAAHLTALRRTAAGDFSVREATTLDALASAPLLPVEQAVRRVMPVISLDDEATLRVRDGKPLALAEPPAPGVPVALLRPDGSLAAIAHRDPGTDAVVVLRGFPLTKP
ncbi:MAG: hypothetical protein U0271_48390 [Polyangiaceae bacterium]